MKLNEHRLFGLLRAKLFKHLLACRNEVYPQLTDEECLSFKPPHYLQACTANLPNMEGIVYNTINFRPKVMLTEDNCFGVSSTPS